MSKDQRIHGASLTVGRASKRSSLGALSSEKKKRIRLVVAEDLPDNTSHIEVHRRLRKLSSVTNVTAVDPSPDDANASLEDHGDQVNCTPNDSLVNNQSLESEKLSDVSDEANEAPVPSVDSSASWHPSDDLTEDDCEPHLKTQRSSVRRKVRGSLRRMSRVRATTITARQPSSLLKSHFVNAHSITSKTSSDHATESDDYCWICHKVGQMVICSCCPRVYHPSCLHMEQFPETWLCPQCQDLVMSECALYQPSKWRHISKPDLQRMLCFLIDRLAMQHWAEHFREPVDTEKIVGYESVISYPMNLRTLYMRNKAGHYASPQAFLGDFRWILHNCIVFNGSNAPVTSHARLLDRACIREMALMKACPTCYLNRMAALHLLPSTSHKLSLMSQKEWLVSSDSLANIPSEFLGEVAHPSTTDTSTTLSDTSKDNAGSFDRWWFCRLCDTVHPLIWVRLQSYPRWPAKVMTIDNDSMLVMFFGDYDITTAPTGSARLHSESRVTRPNLISPDALSTEASTIQLSTRAYSSQAATPPLSSTSPVSHSSSLTGSRNRDASGTATTTDPQYKRALLELDYHVSLIQARYPDFRLPPTALDCTKRHINRYYRRFYSTPAPNLKSFTSSHTAVVNTPSLAKTYAPLTKADRSTFVNPPPVTFSDVSDAYAEPLLTRVADSLRESSAGLRALVRYSTTPVLTVATPQTLSARNEPSVSLVAEFPRCQNKTMDYSKSVEEGTHNAAHLDAMECCQPPIPEIPSGEPDSTNGVKMLLGTFRSQLNEALMSLEEKWCLAQSAVGSVDQQPYVSHPPVLSVVTVDREVQTTSQGTADHISVSSPDHGFRIKSDPYDTGLPVPSLQVAIMEAEISRLDRENQRLNLLLAFTRAEMAMETRNRIMELRRAWNFELSATVEAASKVWEQDVLQIVDAVKRRQWCAYCGRPAYYYCCWNTCYCNSVCQSKHWASHVHLCVQARSQSSTNANLGVTESERQPKQQSLVLSQAVSAPHQSGQTRLSKSIVSGNTVNSSARIGQYSQAPSLQL